MMPATPLDLIHRTRLPRTAQGERAPVVVSVHGWLGNENVMSIFDRAVPASFAIVGPRGPDEIGPDSHAWMRRMDDLDGFRQGLAALRRFVTTLPEAYPVDPKRLYLMGFSQGAAMSLALLLTDPHLIAGAVALAGFIPEAAHGWAAPGKLAGKPVLILHGVEDDTVPVAQAREARQVLEAAGAGVDYREYDVGHKLNAQGMADLRAWWRERA
jgi:phospholipase/carboxylesterase